MKGLFCLFALVFSSLIQANPLNKIVVFGDSLSDNGNLYELVQHMIPESPPYFNGRFTNGPVWVEQLTTFYKKEKFAVELLDYAYGGAAAINHDDDSAVLSLKYEINLYLSVHQGKADKNSFYIIWIGANNYISREALQGDVDTNIIKATDAIKQGVQALVDAGAKHIMLMNLPDLGISPMPNEFEIETDEGKRIPPAVVRERLALYCKRHNQFLATAVDDMLEAHPQTQVLLFDAYSELNKVLYESGVFSNVTESCFATYINKPTNNPTLQIASSIKAPHPSENPDDLCKGYMFFDAIHPTAIAHRLVAERVKDFLANKVEFSLAK